jgi:hypothetical protein
MTLFQGSPTLQGRENYNKSLSEYAYKVRMNIPIYPNQWVIIPVNVFGSKTVLSLSEYIKQTLKNQESRKSNLLVTMYND